jgi:hypothetical protein
MVTFVFGVFGVVKGRSVGSFGERVTKEKQVDMHQGV